MLAVIKTAKGPGNVSLQDVEVPQINGNEALMQVEYCGICGTDIHVKNDTFRNFPPVILGHEFVGRIVEEGLSIKGQTYPDVRYAVLGAIAVQCGSCQYCKSGYFMFCPNRRGMGHGVNGALARYAKVRPEQLFPLSDNTPTIEGALVEPLAVAVAMVTENSIVRAGDTALITGPGPIGLLCLQMLVRMGVRTIVAGLTSDAKRLELAGRLGAFKTVNVQEDSAEYLVKDITGGSGVDAAYEVSGAEAAVQTCLEALRPLGSYTQVGHFGKPVTVPFDLICFKQLKVFGSVGYTRESWAKTIQLLDQGMKPSEIISHRFELKDWEKGFDLFESKEATKVIIIPK